MYFTLMGVKTNGGANPNEIVLVAGDVVTDLKRN
jgi:hypothetical protein